MRRESCVGAARAQLELHARRVPDSERALAPCDPRRSNSRMEALLVEPHPLLCAAAFVTHFPRPLGEIESSAQVLAFHAASAAAPVQRSEDLRGAVRDLLRHGGYKPTGRGKPSSEYLARAAEEGGLPKINLAVDACNAVSLHSGLPISVVDLGLARAPFKLALAGAGAEYVFNASGQTIDIEGLLCLFDADGPCANAVKDAQRTKTFVATRSTLSVLWGVERFAEHVAQSARWYRSLLEAAGCTTSDVALTRGA
jgi:DNA/RNA-binding domain of Phe-tRNA-synthetase-like protein